MFDPFDPIFCQCIHTKKMENKRPCPWPMPIVSNEVKEENGELLALLESAITSLENDEISVYNSRDQEQNSIGSIEDGSGTGFELEPFGDTGEAQMERENRERALPVPLDNSHDLELNSIRSIEDGNGTGPTLGLFGDTGEAQIKREEKNENEEKKEGTKGKKADIKKSGRIAKQNEKKGKQKEKKVKTTNTKTKGKKKFEMKKLPTQKKNAYGCGHCEKSFTNTWNRDRHVRQQHGYERNGRNVVDRFICPVRGCKQPPMLTKFNFLTHIARQHDSKNIRPKVEQFVVK